MEVVVIIFSLKRVVIRCVNRLAPFSMVIEKALAFPRPGPLLLFYLQTYGNASIPFLEIKKTFPSRLLECLANSTTPFATSSGVCDDPPLFMKSVAERPTEEAYAS